MAPRPLAARHVTTSSDDLWVAAKAAGNQGITIRLPDRKECYNIRNRLFMARAQIRRIARAHTGFSASPYDGLKVTYRQELDHNLHPTGHWLLSIGPSDFISFELLTAPPADEVANCSKQSAQDYHQMSHEEANPEPEDAQEADTDQAADDAASGDEGEEVGEDENA